MTECLLVKDEGHVRLLTLNRPDSLNSFDEDLHARFPEVLLEVEDAEHVRAVVVTGAGRAFSAGGNLDDFELFARDFSARRSTIRRGRRLVDTMLSMASRS